MQRPWLQKTLGDNLATTIRIAVVFITAGLTSVGSAARGQTYQVIHYFTGAQDGAHPLAALTLAQNGRFYGTANAGGQGWGDVFELSSSGTIWSLATLYTFSPIPPNGNGPGNGGLRSSAPVVIGSDGDLYGATEDGGSLTWSCGTVFQMASNDSRWTYNVLYRFGPESNGCGPNAPVVFDHDGNIYGTTFSGGRFGTDGVVYKLTPQGSEWQESVTWTFGYGSDGVQPFAGLFMDQVGNLYGTTTSGGRYNWGTVFELSRSGSEWTERVLHNFQDGSDGAYPYAGLISDASGNLYGATLWGPPHNQGGVIFELTPANGDWAFQVIYTTDAGVPSSLTMDMAGNLYGVTRGGGLYGAGSVFRLTRASSGWTYTDLHDFDGDDGSLPAGSLVFDGSGNLYGTTDSGGLYPCEYDQGCGVIFMIRQ